MTTRTYVRIHPAYQEALLAMSFFPIPGLPNGVTNPSADPDIDPYGWWYGGPTAENNNKPVPIESRCWSCDYRRIHERSTPNTDGIKECSAGLCDQCCEKLRKSQPEDIEATIGQLAKRNADHVPLAANLTENRTHSPLKRPLLDE